MRPWAARIDAALGLLQAGDAASANREFEAFSNGWLDIEDDIRPVSRTHYREIERAMGEARAAFVPAPVDVASARTALTRLQSVNASFLSQAPSYRVSLLPPKVAPDRQPPPRIRSSCYWIG